MTLARPLLRCLHTHFFGLQLWQQAAGTSADLLWPVKNKLVLDPIKQLPAGSYRGSIYPS